ncbi:hypothetical protein E4T80_03135 [Muribacter muris]|uniref:Uncharacterized protein n=1 Tax=Muribacter muris TaxID=67855 RepID=A0A4Y9K1U8_9PAST|nr:hypothetical protein [Muribacter muris]MBF0784469.1 hypothetical protein [Muribacter muris]MBF0826235.1 hypothetical protein [Muribacter muris]TFV11983.1 hypothetical protein E4T80_03135 [Muribacter muris]
MKFSEHKFCLENEEAKQFIELLKAYDKTPEWLKANNALWRTISFVPNDRAELQGTIPGATIQIEYKLNKRIQETGKMVLTLHKTVKGVKLRAYQLETNDESKVTSHNGNQEIRGTHEHIGQEVIKLSPLFPIEDITQWFKYFCEKIHLAYTGEDLQSPQG